MKKNIGLCILLVCFAHTLIAQHDSITIKTYVGILNSATYKVSDGTPTVSTSLRVGGSFTWQLRNKLQLRSFGVIDASPGSIYSVQAYWLSYKPRETLELAIGHVPMLSAEQRGFPVSSGGQFETWTQVQIPGAAVGAKVKQSFANGLTLGTAIAVRYGSAEYQGMLEYKKLRVAGYYAGTRKGLAVKYDGDKAYSILVVNEKHIGNTSVITLASTISLKYWSDVGINHIAGTLVRCEGGLLKNFKVKNVSGLIALGYDVKISSVSAYLFVHL